MPTHSYKNKNKQTNEWDRIIDQFHLRNYHNMLYSKTAYPPITPIYTLYTLHNHFSIAFCPWSAKKIWWNKIKDNLLMQIISI